MKATNPAPVQVILTEDWVTAVKGLRPVSLKAGSVHTVVGDHYGKPVIIANGRKVVLSWYSCRKV